MIKKSIIKNITVFDGISSSLLKNVDILLEGNKIKKIAGNISINQDVAIIDGSKFTAIPGLIDCHVHFRSWMPPLFFQFGVTTIRDVGSDPDWIISFREKEKNGDNSLPRIICYGPLLDGVPAFWGTEWKGSVELGSIERVQEVTSSLVKKGVDGFKTYMGLSRELTQEVIKIANEHNLPVTSDLFKKVSAWDAAEMGVTSMEHTHGILFPIPEDKIQPLIDLLIKKNIFMDPTFTIENIGAYIHTVGNKSYPNLNLVPAEDRDYWLNWQTDTWHKNMKEADYERMQKREIYKAKFVLAFHKAGGKVVAGSDTPNPFVIPGLSLHQEIQKMVEIGLSSVDAIKTATSVAAALLRKKDIGVIKEGNMADLVLIDGDPTVDISQLSNISIVIKNGEIVYRKP
ncbi:MAG: amidohydrolase family protein [Candidatus Levybacteria bacterium]|nr:amidohydrolase family protein [Candidatus Levybacteria bacterium]